MRDEVSHLCHMAIRNVARPAGFEPATLGLEGSRRPPMESCCRWLALIDSC
jgi:hypothetical protein